MPFLVRFGRRRAIFRDLSWLCADRRLETELNLKTRAWLENEGFEAISVFESDPEGIVARAVVKLASGKVIGHVTPTRQACHIRTRFFRSRQTSFEFPPPRTLRGEPYAREAAY